MEHFDDCIHPLAWHKPGLTPINSHSAEKSDRREMNRAKRNTPFEPGPSCVRLKDYEYVDRKSLGPRQSYFRCQIISIDIFVLFEIMKSHKL